MNGTFSLTFSKEDGETTEKQTRNTSVSLQSDSI